MPRSGRPAIPAVILLHGRRGPIAIGRSWDRIGAAAVEVLMPHVERDPEYAVFLPFEGVAPRLVGLELQIRIDLWNGLEGCHGASRSRLADEPVYHHGQSVSRNPA